MLKCFRTISVFCSVCAVALSLGALNADDSPSKTTRSSGDKTPDRPQLAMTPEREAAAMHFARSHHPELADLVERLQKEMQAEYDKAIRQLYLASERLARTKERSEEDYELQLEQWKIDSRIKLLGARMSVSADVKLEKQMEKLLRERIAARRKQLERELKRANARVEKTKDSLKKLEEEERSIGKELARYRKAQPKDKETAPTSAKSPSKGKTDDKPAVKADKSDKSETKPTETKADTKKN